MGPPPTVFSASNTPRSARVALTLLRQQSVVRSRAHGYRTVQAVFRYIFVRQVRRSRCILRQPLGVPAADQAADPPQRDCYRVENGADARVVPDVLGLRPL